MFVHRHEWRAILPYLDHVYQASSWGYCLPFGKGALSRGASIMVICEFDEYDDIWWRWVEWWVAIVGSPSIHRNFGHVEGMHVHGVEEHVYCSNHSNTVKSYDWEF